MDIIIEQDVIDTQADIGREFFDRVLGRSYDECLVTDLSTLSDFVGSGMHTSRQQLGMSYAQYCDRWDAWVIARVQETFGVVVERTNITRVQLFARIEAQREQQVH